MAIAASALNSLKSSSHPGRHRFGAAVHFIPIAGGSASFGSFLSDRRDHSIVKGACSVKLEIVVL
jgi:hypothetical protein